MNFLSLIEDKRDGKALDPSDIRAMVPEYASGAIKDYQMAAFLMAVVFRGLSPEETAALTLAMRDSGRVLAFPDDGRPVVDKHSTGGVGDKVSLPLAPLLAAMGFRVPMISGRGLGITGGTLDKLETIPGFTTALPPEQIIEQVQAIGCALAGQTEEMVPADRRMYALRDVSGTVPSVPLITASILSKKLAEGLEALILDVKFGAAATISDKAAARALADGMVALGAACGVDVRALLTDMESPLGRSAGNWLEVMESVDCLEGNGPDDLRGLVLDCAAHLMVQTGRAASVECGRAEAAACLDSGAARAKWDEILLAQGADLDAFSRKRAAGPAAPVIRELPADCSGFVARCDARAVGEIVRDLGGGRLSKESVIDPEVGVDALARVGEAVERGAPLARVHARTEAAVESALARLQAAFTLSETPVAASCRIDSVITASA